MRCPIALVSGFLPVAFLIGIAGSAEGSGPARTVSHAGRQEYGSDTAIGKSALSMVIPGLAQLRQGETNRGLAFMTAEAGFWVGFAVFRAQGSLRKDSYIEMAELFAGVLNAKGLDDEHYRRISNWSSSDAYNQVILREARAIHGDDLEGREAYFQANRVRPEEEWRWESHAARQRYRDKRRDSAAAYKNGRNMLGLALANRVVSTLDAALLARRQGLSLAMTPGEEPASARLGLTFILP